MNQDFESDQYKRVMFPSSPFQRSDHLEHPPEPLTLPMAGKPPPIKYKYAEDQIIKDFHDYIDATYSGHYQTDEEEIQAFDAWIALGDATPTFRNTALKYLWRYGKKDGHNKKDLLKILHYTLMMLYNDHYKKEK